MFQHSSPNFNDFQELTSSFKHFKISGKLSPCRIKVDRTTTKVINRMRLCCGNALPFARVSGMTSAEAHNITPRMLLQPTINTELQFILSFDAATFRLSNGR